MIWMDMDHNLFFRMDMDGYGLIPFFIDGYGWIWITQTLIHVNLYCASKTMYDVGTW